jgi:hypothetical protein
MMPGVLVLAGARQEGLYCDVIVSRFCGLVMLGCLGFHLFLVSRVFFLSSLFLSFFIFIFYFFIFFPCFVVIFVYFLYA